MRASIRWILATASVVLLMLVPQRTGFAQEVSQLPNETLGFVVLSELDKFDTGLRRLLNPWGFRFAGIEPTLEVLCPGLSLPPQPLLIGLSENNGELTPFLLLPVDDYETLAKTIHADRAGDELIVTVATYDLRITPIAGGVSIEPLGANLFTRPTDHLLADLKQSLGDSLATLNVTDNGLERIAQQLTEERGRSRPLRPDLLRIRSFADLWSARSLLPAYAPLMEALSREAESLTIRLGASEAANHIELVCEITAKEAQAGAEVASPVPLANLDLLMGEREPILFFETDRPLSVALVRLAMAWIESQPNEIDAQRYALREFAAYAKALEELAGSVTTLQTVIISPEGEEPLTANQATLMRASTGTPLAELVRQATVRWNEVIRSSKAGTPLEVTIIPRANAGVRLSTDVVAALGGADIEGIVPLMERFYGPKGVRTVDYLPLGDGEQWLSSSLPAASTVELLQRLSTTNTSSITETENTEDSKGQLWVDRWFAWRQRIEDVGHAETKGRRVRPPMREVAPLLFTISGENDRTRIDFQLTANTYKALAEYWLAEKVPPAAETFQKAL